MEAPTTPARWLATLLGVVLLALGVLALILGSMNFGVADRINAEEFLIWRVSGWETILYIATGALGLVMASRVDAARTYSLVAGIAYAAFAVWGFIDGNDVFGLLAVDTTDNIFHAAIGGLGLVAASLPEPAQRVAGVGRGASRPSGPHARAG